MDQIYVYMYFVINTPESRSTLWIVCTRLMGTQVWNGIVFRQNVFLTRIAPPCPADRSCYTVILQIPNTIITFDLRVAAEAFGETFRTSEEQDIETRDLKTGSVWNTNHLWYTPWFLFLVNIIHLLVIFRACSHSVTWLHGWVTHFVECCLWKMSHYYLSAIGVRWAKFTLMWQLCSGQLCRSVYGLSRQYLHPPIAECSISAPCVHAWLKTELLHIYATRIPLDKLV